MTFALVRIGLPNAIVALALAAVPVVALAMTPGDPTRSADLQGRLQGPALAITAGTDAIGGGDKAPAE